MNNWLRVSFEVQAYKIKSGNKVLIGEKYIFFSLISKLIVRKTYFV